MAGLPASNSEQRAPEPTRARIPPSPRAAERRRRRRCTASARDNCPSGAHAHAPDSQRAQRLCRHAHRCRNSRTLPLRAPWLFTCSLFALLALCNGHTVSPTTSPSPSCSAPPGYFCSGGSALICSIGAYCTGGSALNVSCYPVTACTVAGLSAQPPCYWNVSTLAGSGAAGYSDGFGTLAMMNFPEDIADLSAGATTLVFC